MRRIATLSLLLWGLTALTTAFADSLSVARIFGSDDFSTERFGPARWIDGGDAYTTLEDAAGGGTDIVRYDTDSGERTILVSAQRLIPDSAETSLAIADYHWSADKTRLLVFTNTRKVWRYHTRGDYWVLDMDSGRLRQLGGEAPEASLMFAKFAPSGDRVAYMWGNNIYVEDLESGDIVALTADGNDDIVNGTGDWVYEEEFGLRDGFRWSPDGAAIAYWQFDTRGVGTFYMINNTDSIYSRPIPLPYPKVGTTNSACRVGVVDSRGGPTTWFAVEGDPRNHYIPWMAWAPGSRQVVIQQMNRLQNTNRVMLGDIETGAVRTVLVERDSAWIDLHDDLKWLDDGETFTWVSERDGWRHLYRVSAEDGALDPVTTGAFDVISVETIDAGGGWVYYIASPENPTQRYLFRSRLDGSGAPERLTPADQPGTHNYQMAANAGWAIQTWSRIELPPRVALVRLPGHETVRVLEDNAALRERLAALPAQPTEFFRIGIEPGVDLDAWMIKPSDFDPTTRYPLFVYVYGEPARQTVRDRWYGKRHLWYRYLAEQGYVVVSIDNRGTPAPRGREWRKCVYRQIGILASADQAAATRRLLADCDYLDPERVGIWGWSGGGQMTLNAMFRYPELYHTGMAVAFVSDQRLYDTIYQERYMGLPSGNPDGYRDGSPITFAEHLAGNLLIVHGTGDDNVHYQSFEYLVNELVRHNKRFAMMTYPNRSHSISEGENTTVHLYTLLTTYLLDNLPPGGRP